LELKVKLKKSEKKELKELMSRGRESVRVIKRARVLQVLGEGKSAEKAAEAVGVGETTAREIGERYLEGGLERALWDAPRPGKTPALNDKQKQQVVAMVCGPAPEGMARWTIRLLAEEAVNRKVVPAVGRETIRMVLKDHALKPWREKNVVRSRIDAGIRRADGGCSGPLCEAAQSQGAGSLSG
jgi:transposase